jgi:Ca2+-binding RTX toxin-like protein
VANDGGDEDNGGIDNVMPDIETVRGGAGDDTLIGNGSRNTLEGGSGDDTLVGGLGADILAGGDGIDTVSYQERTRDVTVDLGGVGNNGEFGEDDVITGVENVFGGAGDDTLIGDAGANWLAGGEGDDTLVGGGGNDYLEGGEGNDMFPQGASSDGADTIVGGEGIDTVWYGDRTAAVVVSLDGLANDGAAGEGDNVGTDVENVKGGAGNDTLTGNDAANRLMGGAGNDTLRGLGGNDVLLGEDGNDKLYGGPGADIEDGGPGNDTFYQGSTPDGADLLIGGTGYDIVNYASRTTSLTVTLDGFANDGATNESDNVGTDIEEVIGGSAADRLTASEFGTTLRGGSGSDTLTGLGGRDKLYGGNGNDYLDGGPNDDYVNGGSGTDTCALSAGVDTRVSCELTGSPQQPPTTTVPGAPVIGNAWGGGSADTVVSATANWSAPSSDGGSAITGYQVTAIRSTGTRTTKAVGASARTLKFTGLVSGGLYRFEVKAVNAVGTSPASAQSNQVTAR